MSLVRKRFEFKGLMQHHPETISLEGGVYGRRETGEGFFGAAD
jgi:hypothetical protein